MEKGAPFGDHVGPGAQSGRASWGHMPSISLFRARVSAAANPNTQRQQNFQPYDRPPTRRPMVWPSTELETHSRTLKLSMEPSEITDAPMNQLLLGFRGEVLA